MCGEAHRWQGALNFRAVSHPNKKPRVLRGLRPTHGLMRRPKVFDLAEREGFEPSVGGCPTPDFESGTFDHSATSPLEESIVTAWVLAFGVAQRLQCRLHVALVDASGQLQLG